MKIALLSGAVKNAGDYLITRRSRSLLLHMYPDAEIKVYNRNVPLTEEKLAEINTADAAVIGGGPCYKWDIYPKHIPLVQDLNEIKPKLFLLGCGWYGATAEPAEVWNYRFNESSMELLRRVEKDSGKLGCRDNYAVRVLKANGLENAVMTGCPAWYDISKIGKRLEPLKEINRIAVSDPAEIRHNGEQSIRLCEYLKQRYPRAEFRYVFHRGMKVDKYTNAETVEYIEGMKTRLLALGFTVHDISYSDKGFSLYDDCDLHVGHRVHAHIYNLSQRHASLLIEEDARGAGVNEPLGLWGIRAYSRKKGMSSGFFVKAYNKVFDYTKENPYVMQEVETYLDQLEASGFQDMNRAFGLMEAYFGIMKDHVGTLLS